MLFRSLYFVLLCPLFWFTIKLTYSIHHYPEDFVLYRIGKFNSNTGNLDTEGGPVEIYRDTIGGE